MEHLILELGGMRIHLAFISQIARAHTHNHNLIFTFVWIRCIVHYLSYLIETREQFNNILPLFFFLIDVTFAFLVSVSS